MEHDLKESGSDSDLSEGWTVLKCNAEGNQTSEENGHIEASDEDSVESFGAEKLEIPKRDEESDGISIISESDICDHTETIPSLPQVVRDEVLQKYEKELLKDTEVPQIQPPTWRKRYHDSFSESDGCELSDLPVNLSLCPRKVRRQRLNRPMAISELDPCNYIKDFPVMGAGSRIQSRNEACMRLYVHRPNDQVNYLLTILLALALAAVAGLGTGHFLGTKEVLMSPEETVYRLRLENQMLQNQLQKLLKEREVWRRISAKIHPISSENGGSFEDMGSEWSESNDNIYYSSQASPVLNFSLIDNKTPISVTSCAVEKSFPSWGIGFQNINSIPDSNKFSLPEQLSVNSPNVNSKESNIIKDLYDKVISKSSPKYYGPRVKDSHNKGNFKGKIYSGKEALKLADDVKLTLAHGLELSAKLKEALSFIDVAVTNWKISHTKSPPLKEVKSKSLGKKGLKELKEVLYDSGKTKKMVTKTVDNLKAMKKKIFKNFDNLNLWEGSVIKEDNKNMKPEVGLPSGVVPDHNLHSELCESSSNVYSNPVHQDNCFTLKSGMSDFSDLLCDLHTPPMVHKSPVILPQSSTGTVHINEDTNPFQNEEIVNKGLDSPPPVLKYPGEESAVKNSITEPHSVAKSNNDLQPLKGIKQISSKESGSKKIPSKYDYDKLYTDKFARNDITKLGKNQQLKENSNKHVKKQMFMPNEQYATKFQESFRLDYDKKYNNDKKKKQKNKAQKSVGNGSNGEEVEKNDLHGVKYEKKLKHKYRQNVQENREFKRNKFSQKKNNHDSRKNFERKLYEKSHKNINNLKKNKSFVKAYKSNMRNDFRYGQGGWSVDADGFRFTNMSGDWLIKRNEARARQRDDGQKSDWLFERAMGRKMKREEDREKARWYFQRARSREICRVEPNTDWCKTHDENDSHKFNRGEFWKRSQQLNENYHDEHGHSQRYHRDWRVKHTSKYWRGTKFISQAFKAAVNLMKA